MISRVFYFDGKKPVESEREKLAELAKRSAKNFFVWIDLSKPSKEDLDFLSTIFPLHPLAVEDTLHPIQRPKLEEYEEHLFVVAYSVGYSKYHAQTQELDIFLGTNFIITSSSKGVPAIDGAVQAIMKNPALFARGPAYLLYLILDLLVDSYFPVFDSFGEDIDRVEDEVFENPKKTVLQKIFKMKRSIFSLRKIINPAREVLMAISLREQKFVPQKLSVYFRDVYDHLIRVSDVMDNYRDILTGILDGYASTISNKLNETMKVLTIIATIMLPLTLIAGIYGMNFKNIPEIHSALGMQYGYFWALGLMALVAISMLLYFRRHKWI